MNDDQKRLLKLIEAERGKKLPNKTMLAALAKKLVAYDDMSGIEVNDAAAVRQHQALRPPVYVYGTPDGIVTGTQRVDIKDGFG